jgi:carbonic anhydrase/acetyltransferase-like protein (isoleucine patch superfamily)
MVHRYGDITPQIDPSVFVAPDARIIGDVHIGSGSSIWFGTIVRGDVHSIRIGARTNIQDQVMVHVSTGVWPTSIGDDVTVGHKVMLHGCTVGNRVMVGMSAIILDGCEIGDECIIGAGSLLLERTKVPPRSLVVGSPAVVKRPLRDDEVQRIVASAAHYAETARKYREGIAPLLEGR